MGKITYLNRGDPVSGIISHSNNESQEVSSGRSSEEDGETHRSKGPNS